MAYPVLVGTVQGNGSFDRAAMGAVQAGDWLYACIYFLGNGETPNPTPPDGFVELASDTWLYSGAYPSKVVLYRKLATASEPSSYTFTASNTLVIGGGISCVRGGDSHVFSKLKEASGNLTRFPSVTSTVDQALHLITGVALATNDNVGDWAQGTPTGFTTAGNASSFGFGFASRQIPTAGATGIASQAQSESPTDTAPNITFSVAIMPTSGVDTTYPPSTKKARRVLGGRPLARTAWMSDASKTVLANSFFDDPPAQPPTVARPVAWAFFLE